jgi:hypothetical protein
MILSNSYHTPTYKSNEYQSSFGKHSSNRYPFHYRFLSFSPLSSLLSLTTHKQHIHEKRLIVDVVCLRIVLKGVGIESGKDNFDPKQRPPPPPPPASGNTNNGNNNANSGASAADVDSFINF